MHEKDESEPWLLMPIDSPNECPLLNVFCLRLRNLNDTKGFGRRRLALLSLLLSRATKIEDYLFFLKKKWT